MSAAPRILAFATAGGQPAVALVQAGEVLRAWHQDGIEGLAAALAPAVDALMEGEAPPDLVAVCAGPGSFTGIRAGMALAGGLADGWGCPKIAVTQREAFVHALPLLGERLLWCAVDSRRGRVFLDTGSGFAATDLITIGRPAGKIAAAGDAAVALAAQIATRDGDVMLTSARHVTPRQVALAATDRAEGRLAALDFTPLYVDPPAVSAPQGG